MTKVKCLKLSMRGASEVVAFLEIKKPRSNVINLIEVESVQNDIPTVRISSKYRNYIGEWVDVIVGCLMSGSNFSKELEKALNYRVRKIKRIDINYDNLFTISIYDNSNSQKIYEEFLERFYELEKNN